MSRSLLIAFVAVAFLMAPAVLPNAIAPGLSGAAYAVLNLNSSRSNVRTGKPTSDTKPSTKPTNTGRARMGGGGGGRTK
jgi:hypothetical protein